MHLLQLLLVAAGSPGVSRLVDTSLRLCLYFHMAFSVWLPVCPLLIRTPVVGLGPTLIQCALNSLHRQRPYFQIRSRCKVPGGHEFWGHTIQLLQIVLPVRPVLGTGESGSGLFVEDRGRISHPGLGGKRKRSRWTPISSCLT